MNDLGDYMDVLTRLRMRGFKLAIDDFGTGYPSMRQLVRLPFTELKIDQAFVRDIVTDGESFSVTHMATMLAHELGMSVVAEGVEDAATLTMLSEIGCDMAQGYHIAYPMNLDEINTWLQDKRQQPPGVSQ